MYRWTVRTLLESRSSRYVPWRVRRRLERAAFAACRFRDGPTSIPVAPGRPVATLAAVGDVALNRVGREGYAPPARTFAAVADLLRTADLRVANLETVLTTRDRRSGVTGSFLRARPESAEALVAGGFDMVTCANNHCTDFGGDGLAESVEHLHAAGIAACGVGATPAEARRPAIRVVNGLRIGMLGYCDDWRAAGIEGHGPAGAVDADVLADVAALRAQVDVVVLQLHWGWEWAVHPLATHRDRARRFAEAGADLVLCHHAHVPMAVERWGRSVIAHGLGNFHFPWGEKPGALVAHPWRDRSFVLHATLSAAGVHEARLTPVEYAAGGLRPSEGAARREMLGGLAALGDGLATTDRLVAFERDRVAREGRDLAWRVQALVDRGDAERIAEAVGTVRVPRGRTLAAGLAALPDGSGAELAAVLDATVNEGRAALERAAADGCLRSVGARLARSPHLSREPLGRTP